MNAAVDDALEHSIFDGEPDSLHGPVLDRFLEILDQEDSMNLSDHESIRLRSVPTVKLQIEQGILPSSA